MTPSEEKVRKVVHDIWSTQLGLEIDDAGAVLLELGPDTVTAAVGIHGDFVGGVRLHCSRALARRAAAIMFGRPEDRLTGDDERDVAGELANVIAGNIKALTPGHSSISLPTIIDGSDCTDPSLDLRSSDNLGFALDGEPMTVTIIEHRTR